jgi:hypothetical protein
MRVRVREEREREGSTREVWVGLYCLLRQNLGNAPASSMASSWLGCKVSLEDRKILKMSETAIHGIEREREGGEREKKEKK